MKQIRLCILLCFVAIVGSQCCSYLEKSYSIRIKNSHNTDIYYHFNFSSIEKENDVIYPDTILSFPKNILVKVKQGTIFIDNMPLYPIEKWISNLPHDTLSIYIFDIDTLNRYEWDEIQKDYKILQRYDISAEDIKYLNNEVPYPPTEAMKDMKMYPPYKN
jgi:hypothetical protein